MIGLTGVLEMVKTRVAGGHATGNLVFRACSRIELGTTLSGILKMDLSRLTRRQNRF